MPIREAKRLEAGVGVEDHVAELIVIHALRDRVRARVNDQPEAAEMVRDNPIRHAVFNHVLRDVVRPTATVHKARDEVPIPIQLRHGFKLVFIQETLDQTAVDLLADPAVLAIDKKAGMRFTLSQPTALPG